MLEVKSPMWEVRDPHEPRTLTDERENESILIFLIRRMVTRPPWTPANFSPVKVGVFHFYFWMTFPSAVALLFVFYSLSAHHISNMHPMNCNAIPDVLHSLFVFFGGFGLAKSYSDWNHIYCIVGSELFCIRYVVRNVLRVFMHLPAYVLTFMHT